MLKLLYFIILFLSIFLDLIFIWKIVEETKTIISGYISIVFYSYNVLHSNLILIYK